MKKFYFKTEFSATRFKNSLESKGYENISLIFNGFKYTVIVRDTIK